MQSKKLSIGFAVLFAIFAVTTLMTATPATAQTEKVLYSFNYTNSFKGPFGPPASLIFDADGSLWDHNRWRHYRRRVRRDGLRADENVWALDREDTA